MSSILYIGKDYCRTLEQLQQYFRKVNSAEDPLYQELLTLQRDGLIVQWLEEGTEREKELAKKIKTLSPALTNRDLMVKLGELITSRNAAYVVSLLSYVELKEAVYSLTESSVAGAKSERVATGDTIEVEEKYQRAPLRVKLTFKVIRPEKEIFRLTTTMSYHGKTIEKNTTELRLNNEPTGKEVVATLAVPMSQMKKDAEDPYLLEIRDESQVLFSAKISPEGSGMYQVNGVKFKMIKVEGGTFRMGEGSDAHDVTLCSYRIGETQVTQALWKAVMGSNPSRFEGDDLPVESVSWHDCQKFISKLNQKTGREFRLPTEAEWEFAARGGKKSKGFVYSGSNNINDVAWYDGNSNHKTHPVKEKKPNELGIYDMSGNVREWCQDWFGIYKVGAQTNPTGPTSGYTRMCRGGSWYYVASCARVSRRDNDAPDKKLFNLGLRLALSE